MRIKTKQLSDLRPAEYNPRSISDRALEGLGASLDRFGLVQPVVWNERTGRVVGGHQRLKAMEARGVTKTDVVVVDLPDVEERALNVSLNNPAIAGDFTDDLRDILEGISDHDEQLFDSLRLDDLMEQLYAPEVDLEDAGVADASDRMLEEQRARWGVEHGQLWALGDHRLLCGDATSADDVARCLCGAKPALMVTDPPYGVDYQAGWRSESFPRDTARATGKVSNDDRADWSSAWAHFGGDIAYVWHASGQLQAVVLDSLHRAGLLARASIIWAKANLVIGRGHYHTQHEPCWYAVRKGRTARWIGGSKQTSLWHIERPLGSATGHSTQKPLECMARPIRNHDSEFVYEPFSGSGTTIIACERLSRKCRAIEIEPAYVAVALQRYQDDTGGAPELLNG